MKRCIFAVAVLLFAAFSACTAPPEQKPAGTQSDFCTTLPAAAQTTDAQSAKVIQNMTVESTGIMNGIIGPKYGNNGQEVQNGVPVLSFPLEIKNAPKGTKYYAIYMEDPDSMPLCGYSWVHWMAVNITLRSLPEDFSRNTGGKAVQGTNDFGVTGYGGPAPPDKDHTYTIKACALDAAVDLPEGFKKQDFEKALEGHILAEASIKGIYKK